MTNSYAKPVSAPRLLAQVREVVRLKHYSLRTEQAYIHWIKRSPQFFSYTRKS